MGRDKKGIQSLAFQWLMILAIALLCSTAMLFTQPSGAFALESGDFEYEIGEWRFDDDDSGITKDFGYGARITKYTGASSTVVVPATLGGQPVVSAIIGDDDSADILKVDVSKCSSLKDLGAWAPEIIQFGDTSSIKYFYLQDGSRMSYLDLSNQKQLETFYVHGYLPDSWNWCTDSLRYIGTTAGSFGVLDLSGANKLEVLEVFMSISESYKASLTSDTLNLDGCTSLRRIKLGGNCLTSFDVSKFPNLEELYLQRNYIADTSALDAWLAQDGHTGEIYPQNTPEKTFSSADISLSASTFEYNGKAQEPTVSIPGLVQGTDYWVHYYNNVQPGTARVVVAGKGDYRGVSLVKTFSIVKSDASGTTAAQPPAASSVTPSQTQKPASSSTKTSLAGAKVTVASKVCTGKALKPAVKVTLGGKMLKQGTDYTVSYKGNKNVGKATVTVKGKGSYTGTKIATFKIVPKKVSSKKPVATKRGLTAKWKAPTKAQLKQITGFKVQWSTDKKFKKGVKSKIVSAKKTSLKVSKLKSKKTYYVRVCAYKKIGKTYYYSAWSKVQKVKTK